MNHKFYAYMWVRENGAPYYIGKGFGGRAFKSVRGHRPPKDHTHILLFPRDSEQAATDTEKELIRNWGRKDLGTGCLHNRTSGGEGKSGYTVLAETREKIRAGNQGKRR